jgi:hypothetical protein
MVHQSQYVRYERVGNRVKPVRVVKQWDEREGLRGNLKQRVFKTVRVTELKMRDVRGDREQAPEAWTSSPARVESRERLLGLVVKYELEQGGEPVLVDPYAGPCLAMGETNVWAYQARIPLEAEPESREWHLRRQWAELRGHEDDEHLEAA